MATTYSDADYNTSDSTGTYTITIGAATGTAATTSYPCYYTVERYVVDLPKKWKKKDCLAFVKLLNTDTHTGFKVTMLMEKTMKKHQSARQHSAVYDNVAEALKILSVFDKVGEPNDLVSLARKAAASAVSSDTLTPHEEATFGIRADKELVHKLVDFAWLMRASTMPECHPRQDTLNLEAREICEAIDEARGPSPRMKTINDIVREP